MSSNSRPPLRYDVFVAPEKPFSAPVPRVGDPYNHCRMFVGATTAESRAEWIAALGRLAALNPRAVVAGHKDPTRGNPPSILSESRGYLEYYGELREAALSDQDLFDAMVSRYPDWISRQQFLLVG